MLVRRRPILGNASLDHQRYGEFGRILHGLLDHVFGRFDLGLWPGLFNVDDSDLAPKTRTRG